MADKAIDYDVAVRYWSSVTADEDGVLGGYGSGIVPKMDVTGSLLFVKRLKALSPNTFPHPPTSSEDGEQVGDRILDVGAGIGRVTRDVLSKFSSHVDLLEPAPPLIARAREILPESGIEGEFYELGLQDWEPQPDRKYWCVWCQWVLSQATDEALVAFLERAASSLQPGGLLVVKENTSSTDQDLFDETDSSVARTDAHLRAIFSQAGLRLLLTTQQKGMPEGLLPIRMYALQPSA